MIYNVINFAAECATAILYVLFFFRCMKTKAGMNWWQILLATSVYVVVLVSIFHIGIENLEFFTLILSFLYCMVVFADGFRLKLLWPIIALVLNGIVDFLVMNISVLFPGISFATTNDPGLPRTLCLAASKAALFICYFCATIRQQKNEKIAIKHFALLLAVPVGCWLILSTLFIYSNLASAAAPNKSIPIVAGFGMLFILMSSIILYNQMIIQQKEKGNMLVQLQSAKLTQNHIEQLHVLHQQISVLGHNLNHHFAVMKGYQAQDNAAALWEYFDQIPSDEIPSIITTGHPVLDALLGTKLALSQAKGIQLHTHIVLPPVLPIDDVDLSLLIGNMLDNAFEALDEMPNENKNIRLTMQPIDKYWVVNCENPAENKMIKTSKAIPSTKRRQGELHGIGTNQIHEIAQKTGGFVQFKNEDGLFSATAMLHLSATYVQEKGLAT